MAYRVTSSAPGKVILFGEHAVVHGVTAVAASLSDLRIYVDVATTKDPSLCIYLHDFSEDGPQKDPFVVKYSDIRACLGGLVQGKAGAPKNPENPTDEYLDLLKNEFEAYPSHAAHGLMAIGYMMVKLLPELVNVEEEDRSSSREMPGLRIEVKSVGLPIGGGLGSSAAFSVALSAAFLRMRQALFQDVHAVGEEGEISASAHSAWPVSVFERDFVLTSTKGRSPQSEELLNTINAWAYAAEVVIHGAPSGLDNTTSCFGGALKYQRGSGSFERLPHLPNVKIVLTNTKVPRSTKVLVAGVQGLLEGMPGVITPIFSSIEDISQRFLALIGGDSNGDSNGGSGSGSDRAAVVKEMSQLVRINHCLLNAIGVGHRSLDEVFAVSARHGFACKLTGAGGGGCAITLLDDTKDSWEADREVLREEIEGLGYDTFLSGIGGDGVQWHS